MIYQELSMLGKELKAKRLAAGFSQRKASGLSGLTQYQITCIENSKTDYTMRSYLKYKSIFKKPL